MLDPATTIHRCACCGRRLTAPKSLDRGLGPDCWSRTHDAQLDARRTAVGARLDAVRDRLDLLPVRALALVAAALGDLEDAIGTEAIA